MVEMFDEALARGGDEAGLVRNRGEGCDGLALYCDVAGASRVRRVDCLLAPDASAAGELVQALTGFVRDGSARLLVAELPDDVSFTGMAESLVVGGFLEEGRVAELIAPGIAMRLLCCRAV